MVADLALARLFGQHIAGTKLRNRGDAVNWMGAVQAQDYPAALWGIGLRTRGATASSVEAAIADKKIVRTWPMRGTLHFVAPADVRWMLKYLTPRIVAPGALRFRQLHLNDESFSRAGKLIARTLVRERRLTRDAIYALLEDHRISCAGQRGIHILWRLAQEGLICFGPREGNQPTFVLLEEWVPATRLLPRDEALAKLAQRYFASHGPATIQDFAWWSGLTAGNARSGFEDVQSQFVSLTVDGRTYWMSEDGVSRTNIGPAAYLLPAFDEYLVGYKDRSAAIDRRYVRRTQPGGGVLYPTIVTDGKIVATWSRNVTRDRVSIHVFPFSRLAKTQHGVVVRGTKLFEKFMRRPVDLLFK
jgi:hypothetical protein